MKNDDGFIYEEEAFSDEDKKTLTRLKGRQVRDPVTGRKQKAGNPLNSKNLSRKEFEEFMTEEMRLDF